MRGTFCPLKSLITRMRGSWQEPERHQEPGTWLLPQPCPSLAMRCPGGPQGGLVGRCSTRLLPPESSRRGQGSHTAVFSARTWGLGD